MGLSPLCTRFFKYHFHIPEYLGLPNFSVSPSDSLFLPFSNQILFFLLFPFLSLTNYITELNTFKKYLWNKPLHSLGLFLKLVEEHVSSLCHLHFLQDHESLFTTSY